MSWADVTWDWSGDPIPVPATPLRDLTLAALAAQVLILRACAVYCADCQPGGLCDDHAQDLAAAREYEAAYMRVRGIGSDGAMLELIGGLTL